MHASGWRKCRSLTVDIEPVDIEDVLVLLLSSPPLERFPAGSLTHGHQELQEQVKHLDIILINSRQDNNNGTFYCGQNELFIYQQGYITKT